MNFNIKSIEIINLYGVRDFKVRFSENRLIIVGENGSGKTTISRIIYAVLSCNWDLLRSYPFEKINLNFEDESITISSTMINDIFSTPDIERIDYFSGRRSFRQNFDGFISTIIEVKRQYEQHDSCYDNRIGKHIRSHLPYEYFSEIINSESITNLYEVTNRIQEKFNARILYLPTYRRIEEQLKTIFPDIDNDTWEKARRKVNSEKVVELVEFGMEDVAKLVNQEQDSLKLFSQTQQKKLTLGYLSEIVSENYLKTESYAKIRELTDEQIQEVLARIDSSILSETVKKQILSIINSVRKENQSTNSDKDKIICHYFMQLMAFNQDLIKAEENIRCFQNKCNKYLISNRLEYNSQDFTCKLINRVEDNFEAANKIEFQNLSSGEKQIVSLFSHLYLVKDSSIFVFIDEPELSLSVDWQRTFLLDIVESPNCVGLLATTHSPFIFDNKLEENVHGINEFCSRG